MSTLPEQNKMIFVVGNSRSGTTMLGRVLGNIPSVFTFHELHFFEYLWDPSSKKLLSRAEQIHLAAQLLSIERDGYLKQRHVSQYLNEANHIVTCLPEMCKPPQLFAAFLEYEARLHNRDIPCDQTPRNVFFINHIIDFFPNSYVINMIRDPRDILLSQKNKWRRRSLSQNRGIPLFEVVRTWTNYHPINISILWNKNIQVAQQFEGHPRLFNLHFEVFLQEPEVWMKKICTWLSIKYTPDYMLVPQVGSSHSKDNPQECGIKREMAGRWQSAHRRDQADLVICEWISHQNMEVLGYPSRQVHANPLILLWVWLTWPVKTGLALLFNLGRSKNIFASIVRRLKQPYL